MAHSAHLRYVSDAERGLARRRRGKSFTYVRPGGALDGRGQRNITKAIERVAGRIKVRATRRRQ